ncbi:glucose dehydrogenase [FAD, quinone]-like isoform X1 [Centruroides sculpturatus]|uniref:glucose dehydrogenase [FAD, quinone]-like isoform X1 n=2 Tax=Centruroides sculpturatus TaxID=218467 RepID=UPI000C6CF4FA|nr:glucose dehydrogenase [FAD, quinone]-like isoform X1 [Centruroides sculpturatus]
MADFFGFLNAALPLLGLLTLPGTDDLLDFSVRSSMDSRYHYVVVGAGSAGATLANRLSRDPSIKVLLLEAGEAPNYVSEIPLFAAELQLTKYDWRYRTSKQKNACYGMTQGRCRMPRGKVLGGSSILNYMLYIRGNRNDYDRWQAAGCDGWSWNDVFPYFLKSEDNRDADILRNGYHRAGGELTVSRPPYLSPLSRAFVAAGEELGYPETDPNGPTQKGFVMPQGTVRNGSRCSTAKAFLLPARNRSNLHIVTSAFVTKVLFDSRKRARAVQVDHHGMNHVILAENEIILSAGAINTPQLLMLSGIGPRRDLDRLKIPVLADLLVGYNLQDHIGASGIHFTIDAPYSVVRTRIMEKDHLNEFLKQRKGMLTMLGGVEGLAFVDTPYANKSADWPDIEIHFVSSSPSSDGGLTIKRVMGLNEKVWKKFYLPYLYRESFSAFPILLRPKSRGFVKLKSTNPYDPPVIDPKYLSHPDDLKVIIEGMKLCKALGFTSAFKKFGSKIFDAPFPGCEKYQRWSDQYLACMARVYTVSIYHPAGTCKMGNLSDPTAVLDPQLR